MILDFFLLLITFGLLMVSIVATICVFITLRYKVPPVPTGRTISKAMIQAAQIKPGEVVYDLGCGFGGLLFEAVKSHPENKYLGVEILGPAVLYNRILNWLKKTDIQFINHDFFTLNLKEADVILVYLWPSIMAQIETHIWSTLKPGTILVSHAFRFPNVQPTETISVKKHKIYIYVR